MPGFLPACRRILRSYRWLRLIVSLLLLISLSGTHWWMLQSVAWSGMLITYSATSGLLQGVAETFDGQHPCKMCAAIEKARESESAQTAALAPVQKCADVLGLPPQMDVPLTRVACSPPAVVDAQADTLNSPPPLPPPRTSPV